MQSRRFSDRDTVLSMAIEPLETRLFMSAAQAKATVLDLVNLTSLPKKTASALTAAMATAYQDATSTAARNGAKTNISATRFTAFTLDLPKIKQTLAKAPLEFTAAAKAPLVFALPMPDGTFARFNVVEAPIVEPALAKKFPDIKTYRGQGIEDPTATIRFDYTQLGFHAQVLSSKGAFYVDPYHLNDAFGTYASYYKRDLPKPAGVYTLDDDRAIAAAGLKATSTKRGATLNGVGLDAAPFGNQLRTFRAAIAANGEYTQAVGGGTVAGGQASVVTAMNRLDGVFETELAIRMTLVANNSSVIYTNPNTDPYSNDGNALNQNTPNLNSVIGTANYDIGHVFTTGSGGAAFLNSVGNNGIKGGGTTGSPSPTGDAFYIDYVAHEMGHQFGAEHSFNTSADPNRSASHAYEPGSGSTIMGYAGITGDDMQAHSDPYFHSDSIDAIRNFVTAGIPSVGTTTNTGNNAPTVNAGASYTIPTGTPFVLTASGSDPDGDAITYDWQERDLGPANLLSSPDNGSSPIIRAMVPSTSPSRMVPRLSNLLNNTFQAGEKLPTVARSTFSWRVSVRDNRSGGGGVASSGINLAVVNTGSAFAVTSPNTAVTWSGGQTKTITWNVAGTTGNGINTANVKISLSLDGGNTYPVTLAASTANDGSEDIEVPFATGSTQARLKIEAIGNIFFDISNQNFTVVNVPISTQKPGKPALLAVSDSGTSNSDGITNRNNSTGKALVFDVPSTINGAIVRLYSEGTLIGTGTGNGSTVQITTNQTATIADGVRAITARQEAGGLPESADSVALNITVDTVGPTQSQPANFDLTPAHSVTFVFGEDVGPSITQSQGATLNLLNNTTGSPVAAGSIAVSYNAGLQTATYTFPGLSGGKLADGSYSATSQATDIAGNAATGPAYNFIYAGGTGGHSFYVRRSSGAATDVEIYKDTAPDGSPDIVANYATLAKLQLEGSAADDTVTVDFINGNPIPSGFALFRFAGGAGNDTFNVTNPGLFYFDFDPLVDTQNLTINVSAGATVELDGTRSHVAGVNLNGGTMIIPDAGYIVLLAKSLTITNGGVLDLNNNDMIIDYPSGGPSPAATIQSYITSARNGGPYTGTGLTSTNARNANPKKTTLALLESAEYKSIYGPGGTFSSEPIDTTSVLIKYTYYGDSDYNGVVNFDDYSRTDAGYNIGRSGWLNGDFDGNGIVDFDDYSLIDLAYNTQSGTL